MLQKLSINGADHESLLSDISDIQESLAVLEKRLHIIRAGRREILSKVTEQRVTASSAQTESSSAPIQHDLPKNDTNGRHISSIEIPLTDGNRRRSPRQTTTQKQRGSDAEESDDMDDKQMDEWSSALAYLLPEEQPAVLEKKKRMRKKERRKNNEEDSALFREETGSKLALNDIQYFMEKATSTPLLSKEEERGLTDLYVSQRTAWRQSVLSNQYAQRCALEIYALANKGPDRTMRGLVQAKKSNTEVRADLNVIISSLKTTIEKREAETMRSIDERISNADADADADEPRSSSTALMDMLETEPLSQKSVKLIMKRMHKALEKMKK